MIRLEQLQLLSDLTKVLMSSPGVNGQGSGPSTPSTPPVQQSAGSSSVIFWIGIAASIASVCSVLWAVFFGSRSVSEARREHKRKREERRQARTATSSPTRNPIISNLPTRPRLVGRDHEIAELVSLLRSGETPGVLIKGPAGIGKSVLALTVAHEILAASRTDHREFDAIFQISAKATQITVENLCDALGRFLGFPSISSQDTKEQKVEQLYKALVGTRLLLLLDNLETIDDPEVLRTTFELPPGCRLLLTSRAGIAEDKPVRIVDLKPLGNQSAHELLQREFNRLNLGETISYNRTRVDQLLALTGGSPLGIKWAAGRLGQGLSIDSVVGRLLSADADFFEATFADNWTELKDPARRALMTMAVLSASVDGSIITESIKANTLSVAEDAIADLVTISLFEPLRVDKPVSSVRYGLHPLARAFASRKLAEYPNSEEMVRFPIATALLSFIDRRRFLGLGKDEYDRIELEVPNVIECIDWLASKPGMSTTHVDLLIALANAINVFLWSRGYWSDRVTICQRTADIAAEHDRLIDAGRHAAFVGIVRFWQGNTSLAQEWASRSESLMAKGQNLDLALSRRLQALIRHRLGDTGRAIAQMLEVLDVVHESNGAVPAVREKIRIFADWVCSGEQGYRTGEVALTQEIGIMYADRGDRDQAVYWLEKSRKLAEEIADTEGASIAISHMGRALAIDTPAEAIAPFQTALRMAQDIGRRSTEGRCRLGLAQIALRQGNLKEAASEGRLALDIFDRLGMIAEKEASQVVLSEASTKLASRRRRARHH